MEIFNPRLVSSDLFVNATNDRRGRSVTPFLRKVQYTDGASLAPKKLRSEDQIEAFPYSFQGFVLARYSRLL